MENNNKNIIEDEEYINFRNIGEFDKYIEKNKKNMSFDEYLSLKQLEDYWQRQNWLDSLEEK